MLDLKRIREKPEEIKTGIKSKGVDCSLIDKLLEMDSQLRQKITELQSLRTRRNEASEKIGELKLKGYDIELYRNEMRHLGEIISKMEVEVKKLEEELNFYLLRIPNVPYHDVPVGTDSSYNEVVRLWGCKREFDFTPRNHIELGKMLGIMDLERAARMSGSGFPMFINEGALLVRGLINFMLDIHVNEHGYKEVWPPVLCKRDCLIGTGQLPKLEEEMYKTKDEDLFLIPTAEVPLTNIYREEIIEEELPIYVTAYSVCFRREAGAAGKSTHGIRRVHQFDKVELMKFVEPEKCYEELEKLVADAEDILQRLGLHYRVVKLCTGDLSFAASKCYDIELWAPGENEWLEVSSCSTFEDFQARRAGIKYRDKNGRVRYVGTLNGSGVALPRLIIAILENYQQKDGSVVIPESLRSYVRGIDILKPRS